MRVRTSLQNDSSRALSRSIYSKVQNNVASICVCDRQLEWLAHRVALASKDAPATALALTNIIQEALAIVAQAQVDTATHRRDVHLVTADGIGTKCCLQVHVKVWAGPLSPGAGVSTAGLDLRRAPS